MSTTENAKRMPAETITEKELWAVFVENTMKRGFCKGLAIEHYKPDDFLRDPGNFGDLEDFSNALANDLLESNKTEYDLGCWIRQLKTFIGNLETVAEDFEWFKSTLAVESDGERRFRRPVIKTAQETA